MKILYKKASCYIFLLLALVLPITANAQIMNKLKGVGAGAGYADNPDPEAALSEIIGSAISAFLSILGVIFIILMLLGGYHWMTASGDDQKVDKAKNTIRRAIIGLIITIGSYAIWYFIYDYVINPTP